MRIWEWVEVFPGVWTAKVTETADGGQESGVRGQGSGVRSQESGVMGQAAGDGAPLELDATELGY